MFPLALVALLALQVNVQRTGAITGQVRGPDGSPAAGVRVAAMALGPGAVNEAGPMIAASLNETDSNGRYRLANLLPGRYAVSAGMLASPTYYPGVAATTMANALVISAGSTTNGIDFALLRVSVGFQVAGRLSNLPKDAPAGMFAVMLSSVNAPGLPLNQSIPEPDGTFRFSRVIPGAYELQLTAKGLTVNSARVEVVDRDVSGIGLRAPTTLSGKVTLEQGGAFPVEARYRASGTANAPASVSIEAQNAGSRIGRSARVEQDGAFNLFLLPGEYRVAVTLLPLGYHVKEISSDDGVDLLRQSLSVGETPPAPIHVTLTQMSPDADLQGVTVTGRVIGLASEPSGATRWISISSRVGATMSRTGFDDRREGSSPLRPDGTFEFLDVQPGTHALAIWPRTDATVGFQTSVEVEDQPLDVTLGARLRIPIQVVDESGQGIEGARVAILDSGYSPITDLSVTPDARIPGYLTTGTGGRVVFDAAVGRTPSSVMVVGYAPGRHASRTEYFQLDAAISGGLKLVMRTGVAIDGQLADLSGKPLTRAVTLWVRAESADRDEKNEWPYYYRVDTDLQGRFRLAGLHPGKYIARSAPNGGTVAIIFASDDALPRLGNSWTAVLSQNQEPFEVLDELVVRPGETLKTLRVSFEGRQISGVVVDEAGRGVAGATVRVFADREISVTSDSEGRFRVKVFPADHFLLQASHSDFGENRDRAYSGDTYNSGAFPQEPLRLVLRRGLEIRGTLLDPSGKPLPNTPLEVRPGYARTTTDAAGRFSLGRNWMTDIEFSLNSRFDNPSIDFVGGYRQVVKEDGWFDELKAGREIILKTRDVVSEPVTGMIFDSEGKPITSTSLRINISRVNGGQTEFEIGTDLKTDRKGQFHLGLLRGKTYELEFESGPNRSGSWKRKVEPGGVSGIRIDLK